MSLSQLVRVHLNGKTFATVQGIGTPPRGAYVAHDGVFYPVSPKTGYPLAIVANLAAQASGSIVLFPVDRGVLAIISGSPRSLILPLDPEQQHKSFFRALLRLTLLSKNSQVAVIGSIPALMDSEFKTIDIASLALPPVINRATSWQMLLLPLALLCLGVAAGLYVKHSTEDLLTAKRAELTAAEKTMAAALKQVKPGREKILEAKKKLGVPTLTAQSGESAAPQKVAIALPEKSRSFTDWYLNGKSAQTTASPQFRYENKSAPASGLPQGVRIVDGQLQF